MKKPFPLFVNLEATPPSVIGNADILLAKVRLLLKFAPAEQPIPRSPDCGEWPDFPRLGRLSALGRLLSCGDFSGGAAIMAEIPEGGDAAFSKGAGLAAHTWRVLPVRFDKCARRVRSRQNSKMTLRLESVMAMSIKTAQ